MIKLCIGVSDVIHANERTLTLNYSLHVNFQNFWLIPFSFMIKKICFKKKLLLWPHIPFMYQIFIFLINFKLKTKVYLHYSWRILLIITNKITFKRYCISLKLLLIDFTVFRAARGSGLAPEKEPRWYKILNQIYTETNGQLNPIDDRYGTSFSLLNNEHEITNSEGETQNGDKLQLCA